MKILSCNVGYFLGFEKPLPDYLLNLKRSCLGNSKIEEECMDRLAEIVESEDPDIIALEEVDQGSIRTCTSGQIEAIQGKFEKKYYTHSRVKYGQRKLLSRFPVFRNMSNAILSRKNGEVREHFLEPGSKQLLLEYRNPGREYSVFGAHLPTMHRFKKKQLKKIREKLVETQKAILCGDFNCYHGKKEVEKIFEDTGYKVLSPGATHPRSSPSRELNLFVVPEDIDANVRKLDAEISDHLPVMLETN